MTLSRGLESVVSSVFLLNCNLVVAEVIESKVSYAMDLIGRGPYDCFSAQCGVFIARFKATLKSGKDSWGLADLYIDEKQVVKRMVLFRQLNCREVLGFTLFQDSESSAV